MRIRFSLESKFVALASALILVGSIVSNSWIVKIYRNLLISDSEKRALLLAESVAISFTNTLLYEQLDLVEEGGLLDNYIQDLLSDTLTSVTGISVYDNDGSVIATDDYNRYLETPSSEQTALWRGSTEPHLSRTAYDQSFEIVYPLVISTKRFGTLLMQFSLKDEYLQLTAFKNLMFVITVAITVLGILIAFLVARTLASPIKRLAAEMRRVRDPKYVADLDSSRADEIGDLERGFVAMLQRLRAAADEQECQQRALVQAEKLASIGTLVAGLAHEINNPLAGLRNCLRRIIARPDNVNQTRKYAELMDGALLRIEEVVKGLLNFSRKKELVLQSTDLNKIIKETCSLVDYRLKNQKLHLRQRLACNLPSIQADPQYLEQVFMNLLLNALDTTPEGGRITVKTAQQNDKVIAEVTDTGSGIPPEINDKIFDPFFTTKPVGKGTGLGLSITKAIVEEHQGDLEMNSGANGTTFRLSFPTIGEKA